jgi:hypothetical protein
MEKKPFKPNFFFVAAILLVLGLAYYARKGSPENITLRIEEPTPEKRAIATASAHAMNAQSDSNDAGVSSDLESKEPLKQWVSQEAKVLDRTKVDMKFHDDMISQKVRSFGREQLTQLASIAKDPTLPMNERILSTYVLGKSELSSLELVDLASRASENKKFEAHSEEEIKSTQERSLKIMAIDAIVKSKNSMDSKLKDLQSVINASNDELVQQYAQTEARKLQQKL